MASLKTLVPFSAPLLVAKLGVPARGFIITWVFSKLGARELAAGALTYTLLMAMMTFFLGILMSSLGVLMAYAMGADDVKSVRCILQQGIWLGLFLSIPVMWLFYHVDSILLFLGQDKIMVLLAGEFARGVAWLFIPFSVVIGAYKLFVNVKKPSIPMLYSFFGLLLTGVLSYGLALGQWGFPRLGISGVGWGLSFSCWVQAIALLVHIALNSRTRVYRLFYQFSWPKQHELQSLWRIGWPVGLKYNIEFLLFFVVALIVGSFSDASLAVYQVIFQFFILASCLSTGVGLGVETLVGQSMGAQRFAEVRSGCYAGMGLGLLYVGLAALVVFLFSPWIAHFFFAHGHADFFLFLKVSIWVSCFMLFDGIRKVLMAILVTFKDSRFPLIVEVVSLWFIGFPVAYVIGVVFDKRLEGLLIGLVIGLLVGVVMMFRRFRVWVTRLVPGGVSINGGF